MTKLSFELNKPIQNFLNNLEIVFASLVFIYTILAIFPLFQPQNPNTSFPPEATLYFTALFCLPIIWVINNIKILAYNSNLFVGKIKKALLLPAVIVGFFSFVLACFLTAYYQNFKFPEALTKEIVTLSFATILYFGAITSFYIAIITILNNIKTKTKLRLYLYAIPLFCSLLVALASLSFYLPIIIILTFLVLALLSYLPSLIWERYFTTKSSVL
jgi:hypothetical protein